MLPLRATKLAEDMSDLIPDVRSPYGVGHSLSTRAYDPCVEDFVDLCISRRWDVKTNGTLEGPLLSAFM